MYRYSDPTRRTLRGKKSSTWYCQRYCPNSKRQKWINLGVTTRKTAFEVVEKLRRDDALGLTATDERKSVSFREAFEAWLCEKEGRVSESYYSTLKYRCEGYWLPFFGSMLVLEITRDTVNEYLNQRKSGALDLHSKKPKRKVKKKSAATMNTDLVALKAFFAYCRERGWTDFSPAEGIRKFSGEMKRRVRALTPEQEQALIEACRVGPKLAVSAKRNGKNTHFEQTSPPPSNLAPIVVVALNCGFRKRTLLSVEWRHVDLKNALWRIPAELMKTKEDYHAPVPQIVVSELRAYRRRLADEYEKKALSPTQRLGPKATIFGLAEDSSVKKSFKTAAKRAGIQGITLHDCRRIYLNKLRERGVPLETTMALTAHRSIAVVMKYYREVPPSELAKAVSLLDGHENTEGLSESFPQSE